eukprot:6477139-Heterocapsa_arctica.AAC.1
MAQLRLQLRVRSDSTAAWAVALRMSSSTPVLNGIGAEIALLLEKHGVVELVLAHIPGRLNVYADVLFSAVCAGFERRAARSSGR